MNAAAVASFKAAKWASQAEMEAFVVEVGAADAPTLVKFLELLYGKVAQADPATHRKRLAIFSAVAGRSTDQALFVPYVRALKHGDQPLRQLLATLIPKVNNIVEHGELCAALNSPDPAQRALVASLLEKVGGKTVQQVLRDALGDKNHQGRTEVIDILVRTGGHHALDALQLVLASGKQNEKMQALRYLGDPKYMSKEASAATKTIAVCLDDPTEQVALAAVTAFGKMCSEDEWFDHLALRLESPRVNVVKAAVEGLRRFPSPRAILTLERMLRLGPNVIRIAALGSLEEIATEDVLGPLVDTLGHKQLTVRNKAGEVLSKLSKAGKLDLSRTIVFLLKSRDSNVRRMAVDLARTVQDPNSALWPKLLSVLRDEDWWVRERVVDVLVEMAGQQLTRHVVPFLTDANDVVRRYAVDVLIRLKDPSSLGALLRMVTADTDWWAREKAVEAIAAMNDARSVPYLVDLMENDAELRWASIKALIDMNAVSVFPNIAGHLNDASADVRLIALECVRKLNDPSFADAIKPLAADPDASVRNLARDTLTLFQVTLALEGTMPREEISPLDRLLGAMAQQGGDDLIIASNRKPMVKKMGKVYPLTKGPLSADQVKALLLPKLSSAQQADLADMKDVDFSYEVKSEGLRFRANVLQEANGMAAVMRIIKGSLPDISTLGIPDAVVKLGSMKNGLVLIGGPTGSGKSTTLAALIHNINKNESRHIICLEDPIEVLHPSLKSLVNQREIGTHTKSYQNALRATLREDPNVILVGELRDLQTISFAVTAAETGHLVFGTVHTVAADSTVDRLINAFPAKQQVQVRSMLSESLRGVVCQYLLRGANGSSRYLAMEIMINNDAIGSLIRKGKAFQIPSVIATNQEAGMRQMDADLLRLFKEGKCTAEEVYVKARNKKDFEGLLQGAGAPPPKPGEGAAAAAAAQQQKQGATPGRPGAGQPISKAS